MRVMIRSLITIIAGLALGACTRNPSMLYNIAGPHAEKTKDLFWFFTWVDSIIFILVIGFLFVALWRRRTNEMVPPFQSPKETEHRLFVGVSLAVAATAVILTIFVGASYAVDRQLSNMDSHPDLQIEITSHQWWWEARYLNSNPSEVFTTANEIHVPLHKTVRLILKSGDVVHSLWFPNLAGKKDIIPGRDQDLYLHPDVEGEWIGKCAEFCGLQHAMMQLKLFAVSDEAYEVWRRGQIAPVADPTTAEAMRGQKIFNSAPCVVCHTIRGTDTTGLSTLAPDLTHLKSRTTIGAGAAPNSKGYLGGWIINPHGIKPGVHMPTILQEPKDFQALLAYLETLK